MAKRYEESFKKTIVELYDSGQSVLSLSDEYGVTSPTIYKWIDKYSKQEGQEFSKTEFLALKKELAQAKEDKEL